MLFRRIIRVSVAGLVITEPRIFFSVDKPADSTQATGEVLIYNLSPGHAQRIYERGESIAIEAGYPSTVGIVHEGSVQRVTQPRRNLAHITRIELGDMVHDPAVAGGVTNRSYDGVVALQQIIRDLAGDLGLTVGPLDAIPAGATVTDWVWTGPTFDALTVICNRVDCGWYEDDGLLRVRVIGNQRQSDAPGIFLSPQTGLIGTPAPTDDGAEVTMFLNPAVKRGGLLTLQSANLGGQWSIVALRHDADNWEASPFKTWCDLRSV